MYQRVGGHDPVKRVVRVLAKGGIVVLDGGPDDLGGLLGVAACATPATIAFMVRHGSGYLRTPMSNAWADRLYLPLTTVAGPHRRADRYAVTVDAAAGIGTGISSTDRAHTIALLGGAATIPGDLVRPGHVVPERVDGDIGEYEYPRAGIALACLAGHTPVAVFCEVVSRVAPDEIAGSAELREFAREHGLPAVSVGDVRRYTLARGVGDAVDLLDVPARSSLVSVP